MVRLNCKTAMIIGAARGIGREIMRNTPAFSERFRAPVVSQTLLS